MADLEIGPAPRQFVGQTPSFPTQAPVLEEVQRSAQQVQETFRRANTLLLAINKQKENDASAGAIIDFHKRITRLNMGLDEIRDPRVKFRLYQEGLTSSLDEIKKNYPNMSDTAIKTIEDQTNSYLQQYHHKMITDEWKRQEDNAKNKVKDLALSAATATDDRIRQQTVASGLTYIDNLGKNGIWNPDRVAFEKGQFLYNYHKEMATNLVAQGDDKSLNFASNFVNGQKINGEPVNLKQQDLLTLHEQALHQLNQKANLANLQWQRLRENVKQNLMNNPTEANADMAHRHGFTNSEISLATGFPYTPKEAGEAKDMVDRDFSLMDRVADTDELDKLVDFFTANQRLGPTERERLARHQAEIKTRLTSEHRTGVDDMMGTAKSVVKDFDPFPPGQDPVPDNVPFNNAAIKDLNDRLNEPDGMKNKDKLFDAFFSKLAKRYGPHMEAMIKFKVANHKPLNDSETIYMNDHMPDYLKQFLPKMTKPKPEATPAASATSIPIPIPTPAPTPEPTPKPTPIPEYVPKSDYSEAKELK